MVMDMHKHELNKRHHEFGESTSNSSREAPLLEDLRPDKTSFSDAEHKALDVPKMVQDDLTAMIAHKISELENSACRDEEQEREISKAVKAEHRKLFNLVNETDTELGKVNLLQKKYSMLYTDMQRLERDHARQKGKLDKLTKDSTLVKQELNKAQNMKNKLETLCRELQKENKRIKEDSKRLAQTEQQKRVELNSKFETTIFDIKNKIQVETVFSSTRRSEESRLKDKFQTFLEQYDLRDKHHTSSMRTKELESLLHQARADRYRKTAESDAQRARSLHSQVSTFSETENELRNQLNIYVEKFRQVEDTLNNSNDLFLNFRKEMESMTKKTKKLEKENAAIRTKCDTANKNILEMAEERASYKKEVDKLKTKSSKLESLCRALQAERVPSIGVATAQHKSSEISGSGILHDSHERLDYDQDLSDDDDDDDYSEASFELHDGHDLDTVPHRDPTPAKQPTLNGPGSQDSAQYGRQAENLRTYIRSNREVPLSEQKKKISRSESHPIYDPVVAPVTKGLAVSQIDDTISEVAGRFSLFQKIFKSIPTQIGNLSANDASSTLDTLNEEERRLYNQACERLAAMTARFAKQNSDESTIMSNEDLSSIASHFLHPLASKTTSSTNRQATLRIPHDKLQEFQEQYETMLKACTSLVQSPDTLDKTCETCPVSVLMLDEALMKSMAVLLSDGDLADLQTQWNHSRRNGSGAVHKR